MDRFTDEQLREYNDAFCMFDKSDLGYILSTELRDMLKTIGINPTDNLLENMMIVVDQDSNGKIEFTEFIDLIDKLENKEKNDIEGNGENIKFLVILLFKFVNSNAKEDQKNLQQRKKPF